MMSTALPRLMRATEDIPSINARAGDWVLDDGERVCLMREYRADALSEEDRAKLRPARPRRVR